MGSHSERKKRRADSAYISGLNAGYSYGQDPASMTPDQVDHAINALSSGGPNSGSGTTWNWFQQLKAQQNANNAQRGMEEYQAMIGESLAALGEYMNNAVAALDQANLEPALEPLKAAQETQDSAMAGTSEKQLRRRGLMSTFTRYGTSGQRLGV